MSLSLNVEDATRQIGNRIAIVSAYPKAGRQQSAIAYYMKTILEPLYSADSSDTFTVFADYAKNESKGAVEFEAPNCKVLRCWRFGHFAPFEILSALLKGGEFDFIHVEYDVYLYGGVIAAFLLPLILRLAALIKGAGLTTTLHGVVAQRVVTRNFLRESGFVLPYSRIGRFGFRLIYTAFRWMSDRTVVLEHQLKEILVNDYGFKRETVYVIPLPLMNERALPEKPQAKKVCGISTNRAILFVGFASYYKGISLLIEAFREASLGVSGLELHIVAGQHPRLRGNKKYEAFYADLQSAARTAGAKFYGFLADDDLSQLLAACDVIVLPYTMAYGGSAALNTALAARKPVLVSEFVYFEGALPRQVFAANPYECARAIRQFFDDPTPIENTVQTHLASRNVNRVAWMNNQARKGRGIDMMPVEPTLVTNKSTNN